MILLDIENLKDAKITLSLILLNVIFFFLFTIALPEVYILNLVQINANILYNYELWRLITPIFLHADEIHLFSNMIALLLFGATVETNNRISKLQFLLIYLISGFIGNIFSLFLLPSTAISLGASGAIFGLIGVAMIMIATENRSLLPFALLYILYFVIASLAPGINIWAHLAGLLGGILCGYLFYYHKKSIELSY
ncbi:MAG: rhomboid family intramembrane serine protease [Promethearchaeota archaeon]|jgi:membrane associated rhomboid family serine protease